MATTTTRITQQQIEIEHYTPASIPLYVAAYVVTVAGMLGVDLIIDDPSFIFMVIALISIGFIVSYVSRKQNVNPQSVQLPALIICGCLGIMALVTDPVQSFLAPANISDDRVKVLAVFLTWLVVFRSFTLVNDGSLMFSCVTTIALLGLVGTSTTDNQIITIFFVFLSSGVFMALHQTFLSRRLANPANTPIAKPMLEIGRQSSVAAVCVIGALGVSMLVNPIFQMIGSKIRLSSAMISPAKVISNLPSVVQQLEDKGDITLGTGPVKPSENVVMRVKSKEPQNWRLSTFDHYSGHMWQNNLEAATPITPDPDAKEVNNDDTAHPGQLIYTFHIPPTSISSPGNNTHMLKQTITITAGSWKILCGAGEIRNVTTTEQRINTDVVGTVTLFSPINQATYTVESEISEMTPAAEKQKAGNYREQIKNSYLQIPAISDTDLQALKDLAVSITAKETTGYGKAKAIEAWIGQNCKYNLNAPVIPATQDAAATFLLKNRQGYCDVFATGIAVLARLSGLPARVANGYTSGEWDDKNSEYVVRDKDRHLWAEIYFPEAGWQKFDATGLAEDITSKDDTSKRGKFNFFTWIFSKGPVPPMAVVMLLGLISYLVKTEFLNRHKTSSKTKNPLGLAFTNYSIVLIYARTLSYFSKAGLKRHEWETPTEYSKRLMDSFPAESQIASDFDAITALFVMFRYGRDTASSSDVATCDKLSDNLKALIKAHGKIGSQNASGA